MIDEVTMGRKYKNKISCENALENAISSIDDTILKLSIAKEHNLISREGYQELKTIASELNEMLNKIRGDI